MSLIERVICKSNILVDSPREECWEWQEHLSKAGYGQLSYKGKVYYAHRVSFFWFNPLDYQKGVCVLHSCDNPKCINPHHLRLGSKQDNVDDMNSRGRNAHSNKTHCKEGHPLSGSNLIINTKRKHRKCRICMNRFNREYRARKRERHKCDI